MRKAIAHSVVPLDVAGEAYIAGENHLFKLGSCRTRTAALLPFFGPRSAGFNALIICSNHCNHWCVLNVFNPPLARI